MVYKEQEQWFICFQNDSVDSLIQIIAKRFRLNEDDVKLKCKQIWMKEEGNLGEYKVETDSVRVYGIQRYYQLFILFIVK